MDPSINPAQVDPEDPRLLRPKPGWMCLHRLAKDPCSIFYCLDPIKYPSKYTVQVAHSAQPVLEVRRSRRTGSGK